MARGNCPVLMRALGREMAALVPALGCLGLFECHPEKCNLDPHGALNVQHSPGAVGCVSFAGFIIPSKGNAVWHLADPQGAVTLLENRLLTSKGGKD